LTAPELADLLGVTARAIRFYEDKGLISPQRAGNTRIYTKRDRARMILILRGKRLGFSLKEIREYLDLYEIDPSQKKQNKQLLKSVLQRIEQLNDQKEALDLTLVELHEIAAAVENALAQSAIDIKKRKS
jgi:DNA-binding transcriptional MerR regulator